MELLLNNDDRTIQESLIDMISRSKSIRILSPYLTKNGASDCILERSDFKLILVLDFAPKAAWKRASGINLYLIKQFIENGHEVFYNPELHSKLFITDDSLIIGSSNFTSNGLFKRKESAIMFSKDLNQKIYSDCEFYFKNILKCSTKITAKLIYNAIKIFEDKDNSKKVKIDMLSEILSSDYSKISIFDDYDEQYLYPKTLNELQKGLKFDLINYEEIENQYRDKFPRIGRKKNEIILFIKTNLYEKNNGYNIITKINKSTSTLYKWYIDNSSKFDTPLKSHNDFKIDRSIELLKLYRLSFDIQPVTGFFAKIFMYLKEKGLIDDSSFSIKLSDFEEQWHLNLIKKRLIEIDEFFNKYNRIPDRNARLNKDKMKNNGTLTLENEKKLKYEGSLRDKMYHIKNKYKTDFYKQESIKQIIADYYNKWGWDLLKNE